jgi:hypothetical protein
VPIYLVIDLIEELLRRWDVHEGAVTIKPGDAAPTAFVALLTAILKERQLQAVRFVPPLPTLAPSVRSRF